MDTPWDVSVSNTHVVETSVASLTASARTGRDPASAERGLATARQQTPAAGENLGLQVETGS